MAVSTSLIESVPNPNFGISDVTFDDSYAAGGYQLSPDTFGFSESILFVFAMSNSGYVFEFDYDTSCLLVLQDDTTTGLKVEVADATDLSAVSVRCFARGF